MDLYNKNNLVFATASNVTVTGGASSSAKNTLMGNDGSVSFGVRYSGDTLWGSSPDVDLIPADSTINATLQGHSSYAHYMTAGTGDTRFIKYASVSDTIVGGAGANDTLSLMGGTSANDSFANISAVDVLALGTVTSLTLGANAQTAGFATVYGGATGTRFEVAASGITNTLSLVGTGGDDTFQIERTSGTTNIFGGGGTDQLNSYGSISLAEGGGIANAQLLGGAAASLTGESSANFLTGNTGSNTLAGLAANDTLVGGDGADSLDGGTGDDSLVGGSGNDSYVIDSLTDVVVEASGAGTGTDLVVSSITGYTLAAEVENLTLGGTVVAGYGNSGTNTITGNASNNSLDGGTGIDTLIGGDGNDTYFVNEATETVVENASEGTDLVVSSITGYTLGANIENLTLGGTAVEGTGNSLANTITGNASNNSLWGGSGADTLIGGGGVDTLIGQLGNDFYIVDSTDDLVVESAQNTNAGTADWILTSVGFTLAANVDHMQLTGSSHIVAVGNALANSIIGNTGDNDITGTGGGMDTLTGGGGSDDFVLGDATSNFYNFDGSTGGYALITDFDTSSDSITLKTQAGGYAISNDSTFGALSANQAWIIGQSDGIQVAKVTVATPGTESSILGRITQV